MGETSDQPIEAGQSYREKRTVPRYSFIAHVEVIEPASDTHIAGRVSEISRKGCYIDVMITLPPGTLIDVRYEDLVDNLEGVSREALRHCGLDWEDACLNFHDTERTVRTASLMQVRKPLYRSAMGGWRRYARHLTPLADALGGDIPAMVASAAAG